MMKTTFLAACLLLSGVTVAAQSRGAAARAGNAVEEKLISCVEAGDAACVARLLAAGARPDVADEKGVAALVLAAQGRSAPVVRLLLDAGADVNKAREGEGTPLCRAALFGRREIAELLVERGAKVNVVCDADHGDTPLMEALRGAALGEMPDDLKENLFATDGGSDADAAGGTEQKTKLRELLNARPEDFLAVARSLLARGADASAVAKCDVGETPLMYASMGASVEMVKALLSRGADVGRGGPVLALLSEFDLEREKAKRLALPAISKGQAAMLAWIEKTAAARAEIGRLLRAAGAKDGEAEGGRESVRADAEAAEEIAAEALSDAIEKDDLKDLARLVAAYAAHPLGARVLPEALRIAVIYSRDEAVKFLLASGVSPDPPGGTASGFTPLIHAAHDGRLEYVRMLLDAGADVNRENERGETALDAAEKWGSSSEEHRAVVELLKARGAKGKRRE